MDELSQVLQNKHVESVFVDDDTKDKFVPLVKKTVTYIVSGLLFNENDEVLMMQEAKSSCRGSWYLPAGRMETNETIEDAVKREVEEETGIICEPNYLISIEMSSHQWFRFNMMCSSKGGKLKTKADRESLQAKWFPVSDVLGGHTIKLRAQDVVLVIRDAYDFFKNQERVLKIRPINNEHRNLLMRLVVVFHDRDNNEYYVLFTNNPQIHLPTFHIVSGPDAFIFFMKNVFGDREIKSNVKSILTIEHCGKPKHSNDGIFITLLVHISNEKIPEIFDNHRFQWMVVNDDNICKLFNKNLVEYVGAMAKFLT